MSTPESADTRGLWSGLNRASRRPQSDGAQTTMDQQPRTRTIDEGPVISPRTAACLAARTT
jgi:hypothetical protein